MKLNVDMPKRLCKIEDDYTAVCAIWKAGNSDVNWIYEMFM